MNGETKQHSSSYADLSLEISTSQLQQLLASEKPGGLAVPDITKPLLFSSVTPNRHIKIMNGILQPCFQIPFRDNAS
jgi:hypothetical protein